MSILPIIRSTLKSLATPQTKLSFGRFFKEPIKCYGVKSAWVEKLAKEIWKEIKDLEKEEIFWLCEELFRSDYCEEFFIAANWTYRLRNIYEGKDFVTFTRRVDKYINNRAKCDTFCNRTLGAFIQSYPNSIPKIKKRTTSKNRRVRRAAAVSFIVLARRGLFLQDIFQIADAMMMDSDDMVQKWYGRMLKVASQAYPQEVFTYVMKHKNKMPRTALRYAIEKLPLELRKQVIA